MIIANNRQTQRPTWNALCISQSLNRRRAKYIGPCPPPSASQKVSLGLFRCVCVKDQELKRNERGMNDVCFYITNIYAFSWRCLNTIKCSANFRIFPTAKNKTKQNRRRKENCNDCMCCAAIITIIMDTG